MLEGLLMLLMTAGCYMVLMLTLADWNVLSKVKSLIESSRTWTKEIQSDAWMVCHNGRLVLLSKQWPWHTDLRSPGRPCSKYIGEETIYIYIRNILFINSMIQYVPHVCMVCIVICWNQDAKLTRRYNAHVPAQNFMWTNVSLWTHVILLSFAKWAFLNLWAIQKAKNRMHSICPYYM